MTESVCTSSQSVMPSTFRTLSHGCTISPVGKSSPLICIQVLTQRLTHCECSSPFSTGRRLPSSTRMISVRQRGVKVCVHMHILIGHFLGLTVDLIGLQELVKLPLSRNVQFIYRKTSPENFRNTLIDLRDRGIYTMIVDTRPESLPSFFTAVQQHPILQKNIFQFFITHSLLTILDSTSSDERKSLSLSFYNFCTS